MKSIKLLAATAIVMITIYCGTNNIDDVNGNTNKVHSICKAWMDKLQSPISRYATKSKANTDAVSQEFRHWLMIPYVNK